MRIFLQDAIVIHEVYEEGAAARDGRLWAGDQILEVHDYEFYFMPVNKSVYENIFFNLRKKYNLWFYNLNVK